MASFDEVVPPGQAGTIRASIHTSNYKGPIGKGVTVTHDDPSQGPIVLGIKANIVGSVTVFPYPSLTLAARMRGFKTPALLLVRKDDSEQGKLVVDGLAASVPWLKTKLRKVTADEPAVEGLPAALPGDYVISVQVENPPVGSSAQTLTFKTGLAREAQVTIPVVVSVRPPVMLQPNDLILQPKAGAPAQAAGQVLAAVRDDLDPKTLVVTTDHKAFIARVESPGERAFRLFVDWRGSGTNAPTETTVHLRVGGESVDLPVRVNLSRVVPDKAETPE